MFMPFRALLISCLLLLVSFSAQSQRIEMYKSFGGVHFESDTAVYSSKQVLDLMHDTPLAYQEFKRARLNLQVASLASAAGSILVVIPLATALVGGEPEWTLAAGGAALLLASIPFNRAFKGHALNALDIYNKPFEARVRVSLYFSGKNAGVVIRY
jgi:hypothetical protein